MGKSQITFPTHRVPEGEWLTDADEAFYLTATTASGAVGQITVSKLTQGANDELTFSLPRFEISGAAVTTARLQQAA